MNPKQHLFRWSNKEYNNLRIEFESGMNIEQIARSHQRSVRAIEFALRRLGLGQDLIINSKDYNILFDKVKQLIHLKIELSVV